MSNFARIELSRYQTGPLAAAIAEIMSVPAAIRLVVWTTIVTITCVEVGSWLWAFYSGGSTLSLILSTLYILIIAAVLGFALGLLRVMIAFLKNLERLLTLILEVSSAMAADFRDFRQGDKEMPTAGEIVEHVYCGVVVPAMETAVSKSLGFLGTPLLWIYRRTLGSGVRYLIGRMQAESVTTDDAQIVEGVAIGALDAVSNNVDVIQSRLTMALGYTTNTVSFVRKFFLFPLQFAFVVAVLIAIMPLCGIWYWL